MKKKIIVLMIGTFLLTGCGKTKSEQIKSKYGEQNEAITNSLMELKITDSESFNSLMILDDNSLYTQLGISIDDVDNYFAALPYVLEPKFYIAVKPTSKSEEKVKKAIKIYIDNLTMKFNDGSIENVSEEEKALRESQSKMIENHLEKEIDGYYIYISSSDNDKVLKTIEKNLKK